MITKMRKIEIAAPIASKDALLAFLQGEEVLHIVPRTSSSATPAKSQVAYYLAQLQLALEFLERVRSTSNIKTKKRVVDLFAGKPIATMEELMRTLERMDLDSELSRIQTVNERVAELGATIADLTQSIASYSPWRSLAITGADISLLNATHAEHVLASITDRQEESLLKELKSIPTAVWQEVYRNVDKKLSTSYLEIIAHEDDMPSVQAVLGAHNAQIFEPTLSDQETIQSRVISLEEQLSQANKEMTAIRVTARGLMNKEADLQFAYDALLHEQAREEANSFIAVFAHSVVVTGWIPQPWLKPFLQRLAHVVPDVAVADYEPEETDVPPVKFSNSAFIAPFEAVTNIYGKPGYRELDPSGALSIFFLLAFGLALTDAGYGIVLMIMTFIADRFMRLKKDMRKMIRLMFMAGASTFVLGALTGGWFGIALQDLSPSPVRDALLSIKLLDPVTEPMKLLGVTFVLGIFQLLAAWVVKAYYSWNKGDKVGAVLDNVPWITMIVLIIAWIASMQGVLSSDYTNTFKIALYINTGVLVLTQGRSYKNPILKIGGGVLSLFGLMSFMSDMLSYSRLLALGLATGIIGFVVNLLAGMAVAQIPVVGFLVALGILLVGHTFNLGINALGAFIHSGRLQFVEFFPKFLDGGGVAYKPFGRVGKYVDNPNDFNV